MAMCSSVASARPTMAASIIPARAISHPMPMASLLEAQAEATDRLGPMAPMSIELIPAAPLAIIIGITNGLTRRGPTSKMVRLGGSVGLIPPTARGDHSPTPPGILRRDGKPRLRQGLLHRWNGQELESVAPPRLFDVDVAPRVEA